VIGDAASVRSQQRSTQNTSFDNFLAAKQTGVQSFELFTLPFILTVIVVMTRNGSGE